MSDDRNEPAMTATRAMSKVECAICGATAAGILAEGVDPEVWFERDDDGTVLCGGCLAIKEANQRFEAGDW